MNRHKRVIQGVVVSDKMAKTRTIAVTQTSTHGLYHKNLVWTHKFFIHDEKNESKVGDLVEAVSSRPLSRHKHFRLQKVIEKRV